MCEKSMEEGWLVGGAPTTTTTTAPTTTTTAADYYGLLTTSYDYLRLLPTTKDYDYYYQATTTTSSSGSTGYAKHCKAIKLGTSESQFVRNPLCLPCCEDPSCLVGDQCQGNQWQNGNQCLSNLSDDGLLLCLSVHAPINWE